MALRALAARAARLPVIAPARRTFRAARARLGRPRLLRQQAERVPQGELRDQLTSVRWSGEAELELRGWAYVHGEPSTDVALAVSAVSPNGGRLVFEVSKAPTQMANTAAQEADVDRSDAGFVAVADLSGLAGMLARKSFRQEWRVTVRARHGEAEPVEAGFTGHTPNGSVDVVAAADVGGGVLVRPIWRSRPGLTLQIFRPAVQLTEIDLTGTMLRFQLRTYGFKAVTARLEREGHPTLVLQPIGPRRLSFELDLHQVDLGTRTSCYLLAACRRGQTRYVHWTGPDRYVELMAEELPAVRVVRPASAVVRLDVVPTAVVVDDWRVTSGEHPTVELSGRTIGLPATMSLQLVGPEQSLPAHRLDLDATTFTASFSLSVVDTFAVRPTAPRPGVYHLVAFDHTDGLQQTVTATTAPRRWQDLPDVRRVATAAVTIERGKAGRLELRVAAPHPEAEKARYRQDKLIRAFKRRNHTVTDSVYFECFSGRYAGDNPLPIDVELRKRRPDLKRFWVVTDYSVEVPEGATPLLMLSAQWWTELARARYVVTNCWLPTARVKRPYQTILQTWHGTPYKRLGLDRLSGRPESRSRLRESTDMWDLLISQNTFSSDMFRTAYLFDNSMLEIGYPRNDVLVNGLSDARRARLRDLLGIGPGQRVVAYLPTWRENPRSFIQLDYEHLLGRLGPDWKLLVRGHSMTRADNVKVDMPGLNSKVELPGVVDATLFPDTAELYLIADVLITDYSSVMFDYSITGKPMIFYVPDLEDYASTRRRGTYFDLGDVAPGPLVRTTDDVADAVRSLDDVQAQFAGIYADWRARYNPWDDGHAASRAVAALLAHKPPGS